MAYASRWMRQHATGAVSVLIVDEATWTVENIKALARTPWTWGNLVENA